MPKERRVNSLSVGRARASPYACSSDKERSESSLPSVGDEKEWKEARCPICMEHPHNAVLLLCSSREKGCRPYMCDTSYRHSNCLDQFRKSSSVGSATDASVDIPDSTGVPHRGRQTNRYSRATRFIGTQPNLQCPLCRGQISGWVVVEPARMLMNSNARSCSLETCNFTGNYSELRKHARLEHPYVRPTEADPIRQSEWTRMEHQRDFEDTLSAYQSFGYDLEEDDFLGDELNEGIFDLLSGVHSEPEDEWWSGEGNTLMDFEFELDFSFLSDIFFSPLGEAMDFSRPVRSSQFRSQTSTMPRSRSRSRPDYDTESMPGRR